MNLVIQFFSSLVIVFFYLLMIEKILHMKLSMKNIRFWIVLFLLSLSFCGLNFLSVWYRQTLFWLFLIFGSSYVFHVSFSETGLAVFLELVFFSLIEVLLALLLFLFQVELVPISSFFSFFITVLIFLINYFLLDLPVIRNLQEFVFVNGARKIIYVMIMILVINSAVIFTISISKPDHFLHSIMILIILGILLILILCTCIEEGKLLFMEKRYQDLAQASEVCERLLEEYRLKTHEYKNQLVVIRSLTNKKERLAYIDSILGESRGNYHLIMDLQNVPFVSIRGLLYYQSFAAEKQGIHCLITISKELRKLSKRKIDEKTIRDITTILGIFLDNAREEAVKVEKKSINIVAFLDSKDRLIFQIANFLAKGLDLEKLSRRGFTTKGNEHGNGLLIVKRLIDANANLENYTEIIGDVFVQNLKILLKNK